MRIARILAFPGVFLALILILATGMQESNIGPLPSVAVVPKTDTYAIFSVPKDTRSQAALDSLGVGWVRLQDQMGEADTQESVAFFSEVLGNGYALWLTLHHRDRTNVDDTTAFDASTRGSFPPADSAQYAQLIDDTIRPLVDFLNSQGKAPERWLVVQFGNEVIPGNVLPDQPSRFWHGSSAAYLETLTLTHDIVKNIDPTVPVAASSISSASLEQLVAFEATPVDSLRPLVDFADSLLTTGTFDWADIHLYHDIASIPAKIGWVRDRWQGPLAVTEDGGPDARTGVPYSESLQAAQLADRIQTTLSSGADRVFWAFLVDKDIPDDPLAQTLGLITLDWVHKPAYDIYRQLIAGTLTATVPEPSPDGFRLDQNFPNPFSSSTTIRYVLPRPSSVNLAVFDNTGRLVRILQRGFLPAGVHTAHWDGTSTAGGRVANGTYFYRLRVGTSERTRSLVLVR